MTILTFIDKQMTILFVNISDCGVSCEVENKPRATAAYARRTSFPSR